MARPSLSDVLNQMVAARANASRELPPERQALLHNLDSVDRGMTTFLEYFLVVIMGLATGFIIFFFFKLPHDANYTFLRAYFGGGYVLLMLFLVGQMRAARKRRTRPPLGFGPMSGPVFQLQRNPVHVVHEVHTIGADALQNAESLLQSGGTLDDVCRHIDPQFDSRDAAPKQVFRQTIQRALESRRAGDQTG